MTQRKSMIGTARTKRAVATLVPEKIDMTAREKPMNMAPAVPAMIIDGLKLNIRKPKIVPMRMAERMAIGG